MTPASPPASRLAYLHLRNTRVTDRGLEHLKGLTKLQSLDLSGTQVGDEGSPT
jgi:hypothetical protein